jgi:hypothetical protein
MVEGIRAGEKTDKPFAPFLTKNVHISYRCQYDNHSIQERKLSFLPKSDEIKPLTPFNKEVKEWLLRFVKTSTVTSPREYAIKPCLCQRNALFSCHQY